MDTEVIPKVTYDQIISETQAKAGKLRSSLPSLPTDQDLEPFLGKMWAMDRPLIDAIRRHVDAWGVRSPDRDYEGHLEWVAKNAAYVAKLECDERKIFDTELRTEIIQRAWRLGLLHDVQAWRGWQPIHQAEGMMATRQILKDTNIQDKYLEEQVLLHDNLNVSARNDPAFDIPYFSVFAVDHLNWGIEWEETRWKNSARKKIDPQVAINDQQLILKMNELRDSSNLQQTKWGREVAIPYVKFGIEIANHIKRTFSRNQ